MVGVEIARALGMKQVIVPPAPGVFSAVGLLFSNSEQEFVRTLLWSADEFDSHRVSAAYDVLTAEAMHARADDGVHDVVYSRLADLRYAGQAYELTVRVPDGSVDVARLKKDFVAEHVRTYGHGSDLDPIDLVSVRVLATLDRGFESDRITISNERSLAGAGATRQAYFGPPVGELEVPVIGREALHRGDMRGPVFIDEYDSTTVVPPGCVSRLDAFGSIEIDVY